MKIVCFKQCFDDSGNPKGIHVNGQLEQEHPTYLEGWLDSGLPFDFA